MNWLLITTESNPDRWFQEFVTGQHLGFAVAIISDHQRVLWAHELDVENLNLPNYEIRTYFCKSHLQNDVVDFVTKNNLHDIRINCSTVGDESINTLSHGLYIDFVQPIEHQLGQKFKSAEQLIYEKACPKSIEQIDLFRQLAQRTDRLIRQVLASVQTGETEIKVAKRLQNLARETFKNSEFEKEGITEGLAWQEPGCPIVLSGINIAKGGHTIPSDKELQPGEVVYIDFGLKHIYPNGAVVNSDLQRCAYVLKDYETEPPIEIQTRFNQVVQAIELGRKVVKPGITGIKVDKAVREFITAGGNLDYPHSTGHPIGSVVHDLGSLLSSTSERGKLTVLKNTLFTIEPRIQMENGISIEEIIVVTESGAEFLIPPQTELILI